MIVFGIDPGKSGAIVAIHSKSISTLVMPTIDKDLDVQQIKRWLCGIIDCDDPLPMASVCYVEAVHAMPGQGVSSMFRFGLIHTTI